MISQRSRDRADSAFRSVDVSLYFAKSDRAFDETSIGVKYRVMRILPTLLNQAIRRETCILHESITIPVAEVVDPVDCRSDIPPDRFHQLAIACSFEVSGGQKQKQRGRINASIIS